MTGRCPGTCAAPTPAPTDLVHTTDAYSTTIAQAVLTSGAWPAFAPQSVEITSRAAAAAGPLLRALEPDLTLLVEDLDGDPRWTCQPTGWTAQGLAGTRSAARSAWSTSANSPATTGTTPTGTKRNGATDMTLPNPPGHQVVAPGQVIGSNWGNATWDQSGQPVRLTCRPRHPMARPTGTVPCASPSTPAHPGLRYNGAWTPLTVLSRLVYLRGSFRIANQNIASGVPLNYPIIDDPQGVWANTDGHFTAPRAGTYLLTAQAKCAATPQSIGLDTRHQRCELALHRDNRRSGLHVHLPELRLAPEIPRRHRVTKSSRSTSTLRNGRR